MLLLDLINRERVAIGIAPWAKGDSRSIAQLITGGIELRFIEADFLADTQT